jgi:flagellar motor switch protein FliN/FliY
MAKEPDSSQEDIEAASAEAAGQAPEPGDGHGAPAPGQSAGSQPPDDAAAAAAETEPGAAGETEAVEASGDASPAPAAEGRVDSADRPFDETAAAMAEAIATEQAGQASAGAKPVSLSELGPGRQSDTVVDPATIGMLSDVNLHVRIELGRTRMMVEDVLRLTDGSVVELDKLAGDPVDVFVNERLIARGEVLVLNDNFCVRINEIVADLSERAAV